eukprot:31439-Pelagococcus_subviridis.AAC.34
MKSSFVHLLVARVAPVRARALARVARALGAAARVALLRAAAGAGVALAVGAAGTGHRRSR